jgi:hypothetical protein
VWGIPNQLNVVIEPKQTSPEQDGMPPLEGLGNETAVIPWISSCWIALQILDLPTTKVCGSIA